MSITKSYRQIAKTIVRRSGAFFGRSSVSGRALSRAMTSSRIQKTSEAKPKKVVKLPSKKK